MSAEGSEARDKLTAAPKATPKPPADGQLVVEIVDSVGSVTVGRFPDDVDLTVVDGPDGTEVEATEIARGITEIKVRAPAGFVGKVILAGSPD